MRRTIRIFSLLVLLSLCLTLCGCDRLEQLRNSRAIETEDGLIQLSDGSKYKLLPECETLCPQWDFSAFFYVVEEDVPLLLITSYGRMAERSVDGLFLYAVETNQSQYYCRTDVYDTMVSRIARGFVPEAYCYVYYDARLQDDVLYQLTPAQVEAVELVYTTIEPQKLPAATTLEYDDRVDLCLYSADYLFCQDTVDICVAKGEYFLLTNDNSLYAVPENLFSVFEGIMMQQMEK